MVVGVGPCRSFMWYIRSCWKEHSYNRKILVMLCLSICISYIWILSAPPNYRYDNENDNDIDISLCITQGAIDHDSFYGYIPLVLVSIFLVAIIGCSIVYYIKFVVIGKTIYLCVNDNNILALIKQYFEICWKFRHSYLIVLISLLNQVSDIYVIIHLYFVKDKCDSQNINLEWYFYCTLSIFLFYRFASCGIIYSFSYGNLTLSLCQFFQLSFVLTFPVIYEFPSIKISGFQRYMTMLEAALESFPEFIVQFHLLTILDFNQTRIFSSWFFSILVISLVFSFLNILTAKVAQDVAIIGKFHKYHMIWRIINVSSRLLLFFSIWKIIGPVWFIAIVMFEFCYYLLIYSLTENVVFLESMIGYTIHSTDEADLKDVFDQVLMYNGGSAVVYSIGLCVLFGISSLINCCDGMDLSYFVIEWFVGAGVFCCLPCIATCIMKVGHWSNDRVIQTVLITVLCFRSVIYFLTCVIFNYFGVCILIGVDLMVFYGLIAYHEEEYLPWKKQFREYFVAYYITSICNFIGNILDEFRPGLYLLFSFQHLYSFLYTLFLVFFCIYDVNVSFINGYNYIHSVMKSNGYLMVYLMGYVGLCIAVLPFWTHYLRLKSLKRERYRYAWSKTKLKFGADSIYYTNPYQLFQIKGGIQHFMELVTLGNGANIGYSFYEFRIRRDTDLDTHILRTNELSFLEQYKIITKTKNNDSLFRVDQSTILQRFKNDKMFSNEFIFKCGEDIDALILFLKCFSVDYRMQLLQTTKFSCFRILFDEYDKYNKIMPLSTDLIRAIILASGKYEDKINIIHRVMQPGGVNLSQFGITNSMDDTTMIKKILSTTMKDQISATVNAFDNWYVLCVFKL